MSPVPAPLWHATGTGHLSEPGLRWIGMTAEDTRIMLRADGANDQIVDHPGQPADYVHSDGTVWTWHERWRLVGGVRDGDRIINRDRLRMYDLVMPSSNET